MMETYSLTESRGTIQWPDAGGFGFQERNLDLDPEASIDSNVGLRYQNARASVEAFAFRTEIQDGIRIAATGDSVGGMPAFRNVNVDELVHTGGESPAKPASSMGSTRAGTGAISMPRMKRIRASSGRARARSLARAATPLPVETFNRPPAL
jgi:hypothetical protein